VASINALQEDNNGLALLRNELILLELLSYLLSVTVYFFSVSIFAKKRLDKMQPAQHYSSHEKTTTRITTWKCDNFVYFQNQGATSTREFISRSEMSTEKTIRIANE
jgi:hypothetical protein